jgi:hypothetical protein
VLKNIKKYLSLEAKEYPRSPQDHPTDEITEVSEKSDGESKPQMNEK